MTVRLTLQKDSPKVEKKYKIFPPESKVLNPILTLVLEEHDHDGAVVLHSLLRQASALVNDAPADDELQFFRLLTDQLGDQADLDMRDKC